VRCRADARAGGVQPDGGDQLLRRVRARAGAIDDAEGELVATEPGQDGGAGSQVWPARRDPPSRGISAGPSGMVSNDLLRGDSMEQVRFTRPWQQLSFSSAILEPSGNRNDGGRRRAERQRTPKVRFARELSAAQSLLSGPQRPDATSSTAGRMAPWDRERRRGGVRPKSHDGLSWANKLQRNRGARAEITCLA
jgi:hypothetical protein